MKLRPVALVSVILSLFLTAPVIWGQTERGTAYGTTVGTTPGTFHPAAGLQVSVRLTQNLSSKTSAEGDEWDGVLAADLVVGGHLLTPSGTQVTGVVSKAISATRAHGSGTLEVKLTSIHGTGVSSTPVMRQGVNPALSSAGTVAAAGIPGEAPAAQNTGAAAANPGAAPAGASGGQNVLAEARFGSGAVLTFTTE